MLFVCTVSHAWYCTCCTAVSSSWALSLPVLGHSRGTQCPLPGIYMHAMLKCISSAGVSAAGSVQRKPDREAFLAALQGHAQWPALNASGFLETFDYFGANARGLASTGAMYSGLLHDSVFVPCPRGRSAEQFRIWEALEAGASPSWWLVCGTLIAPEPLFDS